MKKNPIYSEITMLTVLCLPFIYLAFVWNQLPDMIPGHYGPSGRPDRYDPKEWLAVGLGLGAVFMYGLRFLPRIDPGRNLFGTNFLKIRWLLASAYSVFVGWFWYIAQYGVAPGSLITEVLVGTNLLLAGMGNFMYALKPSFFVGIRTPWTLSNETVWRKTHRLAGWLWVVGGVVGALLAWLLPAAVKMPVSLGIVGLLVLIPVVYSYWIYRKIDSSSTPNSTLTKSMKMILLCLMLIGTVTMAIAQTDEPIRYKITAPVGADLTLDGTLTLPANITKPVPVVLLIAGSGPTDRDCNSAYGLKTNAFRMLADSLTARGIAVARYDKRGSGTNLTAAATGLKPEEHRFDFYVSDAVGFIRQLQADKRFSRIIVAGHSEGSLVGMLAARQTNTPGYISLEGAGRNIAEVMKAQGRMANPPDLQIQVDQVLDSLRAGQMVHPANSTLKAQLSPKAQPGIISWMKYDPAAELKAYPGSVLIIQGRHDKQVAMLDAESLKAARPDARLVVFDEMNHILKNAPDDLTANFATYNQPDLPLTTGLISVIADFVKKPRGVN